MREEDPSLLGDLDDELIFVTPTRRYIGLAQEVHAAFRFEACGCVWSRKFEDW